MKKEKELNIKRIANEKKIGYKALAAAIGSKRASTICDKFNCERDVTMTEAFLLQAAYFSEYTLEELFSVANN